MRSFIAGSFVALFMMIASTALGDVSGYVESIGYASYYRPNCWTPMVVVLTTDQSGVYQIKIKQEDLDRDVAEFTEIVSLTGRDEGQSSPQKFYAYFIPQPTNHGLEDASKGGTLWQLQTQLKVFLCDEKGKKELIQLPLQISGNIQDLDSGDRQGFAAGASSRGKKLVLAVSESTRPSTAELFNVFGVMEDVVMPTLKVSTHELPDDVRAYQAVDAIVWCNAPVPDPSKASDEKLSRAIQEYVRRGGHLVICQPGLRDAANAFGDLLPVTVEGIRDRTDLDPLKTWSVYGYRPRTNNLGERERNDIEQAQKAVQSDARAIWETTRGTVKVAVATPKPGAVVTEYIQWSGNRKDQTPYIVRMPYGSGCVSWVAQDLSDPTISAGRKSGWPFIWDRVMDWHNDTQIENQNATSKNQVDVYTGGTIRDIGPALDGWMELQSKSRALVLIAILFFIAYWVVAGPGIFVYLLAKSKSHWSWFMFGASAIGATLLTVLVVKLVVRGDPELSHVTLVRVVPGQPTLMLSRFGLYVPEDGFREVAVRENVMTHVSTITAFPLHPKHLGVDIPYPTLVPYVVPIREAAADAPVSISVPIRSTLKKFQAMYVGSQTDAIDGVAKLRESASGAPPTLDGLLTNNAGGTLKHVYFVYHRPGDAEGGDDYICYKPIWEKGKSLNLSEEFDLRNAKGIGTEQEASDGTTFSVPGRDNKVVGILGKPGTSNGWSRYWYASGLRGSMNAPSAPMEERNKDVPASFPLLSIFNRLPPIAKTGQPGENERADLLRRGSREWDMSVAIAAGGLVVLAQAEKEGPLPFPLEVDGKKVSGNGAIFYQFVVPLAHETISEPAETIDQQQPPAKQPAANTSAQR